MVRPVPAALASAPGRVYTRRQLLERVWGWDYIGDERVVGERRPLGVARRLAIPITITEHEPAERGATFGAVTVMATVATLLSGAFGAATLASDLNKPDALTLVPRDAAGVLAFLAPLPIGLLRTRAGLEELPEMLERLDQSSIAQRAGVARAVNGVLAMPFLRSGFRIAVVTTDQIGRAHV